MPKFVLTSIKLFCHQFVGADANGRTVAAACLIGT